MKLKQRKTDLARKWAREREREIYAGSTKWWTDEASQN